MRNRLIKPEFFSNEDIMQVSVGAKLLFIGLFCLVDDNGVYPNRPNQIKVNIFPLDDVDVPMLMKELNDKKLIIYYKDDSKGDKEYFWIPGFINHQVINKKFSKYPIPPMPLIEEYGYDLSEDLSKIIKKKM